MQVTSIAAGLFWQSRAVPPCRILKGCKTAKCFQPFEQVGADGVAAYSEHREEGEHG